MSKLLHQMHTYNLHHKPVFVSQIAGKLGGTGLVSTQTQTESKTEHYFINITEISIDKPTANCFLNSIKTHT